MNSIRKTHPKTDSWCCCICIAVLVCFIALHCESFFFLKQTNVCTLDIHTYTNSKCIRGLHLFSKLQNEEKKNQNTHLASTTYEECKLWQMKLDFSTKTYATAPSCLCFVLSLSPNIIIIEPHNCITGV